MEKLLLFIVVIAFSCKNDVNLKVNGKVINDNLQSNQIKYDFDFPDTLYTGKLYNGVLKYESILDTFTTEFGLENKNRYTRLITHYSNSQNLDVEYLKGVVKDTFGAIDNRTIPFYDVKFSKPGTYYIQGLINDVVVINLFSKDEDGNDLIRFIEYDEPVSHKVVVLENKIN